MRVLIVSQHFWPENFSINGIAKSLFDKGIEVEVLTGKPNYPQGRIYSGYQAWGCQQEDHDGIHIHRIPIVTRGNGGWRLVLNYVSFILSGLLFAPLVLRKKKFDVIFVYAPSPILQAIPAIFIGWLKACPVVLWVQDLWPESLSATGHVKNRWVLGLVDVIVRYIYRHTDLILVQSRAFESPVREMASGTPIEYHPNTVDPIFSATAKGTTPAINGLNGGFPVLFAGNIGAAQAVDVIVEAALLLKEYTDVQIVLLGDGSARDWMLNEVQRLGLTNLHLPGSFPVETMPGFMSKASVLLVSLIDKPIFAATVPNKVQAYLAVGRPIIACLNGEGARIVVEAGAGLASPAGNANALAEAILELYRLSSDELREMGNKGRKYYQAHFDQDYLVDKLIGFLHEASQFDGDYR